MGEQMKIDLPRPAAQKERTHLQGMVETGAADLAALKAALGRVGWVGSSNSRGLGQIAQVELTAVEETGPGMTVAAFQAQVEDGPFQPDDAEAGDLVSRVAAFNKAVAAEREFYRLLGVDVLTGSWYFTLDLLADTFVRHYGLPALRLTPEMLDLPGAEWDFTAVEAVERGGWVNAWGLPRPRKLGLQAGGVFLYCVDNGKDAAITQTLFNRLEELERNGIGEDRERGAGRLMVCAPFHKEIDPR
jgi:hypothetical protein